MSAYTKSTERVVGVCKCGACAPSVGHLLHLEQTRCPDSNPSLVWVVRIRSVLDFRVRCRLGCEQYHHNLTPSYKFNMRTRYNSKDFWVFSGSKAKTFSQRQYNWFIPRFVFNILVFSWGLTVKQNVCYSKMLLHVWQ